MKQMKHFITNGKNTWIEVVLHRFSKLLEQSTLAVLYVLLNDIPREIKRPTLAKEET